VTAGLLLTSQLFEQTNPELALKLNPLSADARIKLAVKQLTTTPAQTGDALATAIEGITLHRLDSRFLSLAGVATQVENEPTKAEAYFRSSLAISPTEFQALNAMLRIDLQAGNMPEAAERFDLLTRRWGKQNENFVPLIATIVNNPIGYDSIQKLFSAPNGRRDLVVKGLLEIDGAVNIASSLVSSWAGANVPDRTNLVNQVTAKLLKLKLDQAAYVFNLTYGGADETDTAYVKNGTFNRKPDQSPFDWLISKQRGVNVTTDANYGARIQFLDSPVQFENLSQLTALAPGKHVLQIEYSAQYLKTPSPVRAEIRCRSGRLLGSIEIDPQQSKIVKSEAAFEVPTADCLLQRFAMSSDKLPESWQNRYSGGITLRSVSIERVEQ
jgi:hypothetical protein